MALHKTCDGMARRDFLRVGAVGASALSLGSFLRMSEAGQINPAAKAKSAIFINLPGGPSHMDTFDLKPNASDEYRGEFSPIQTKIPGIEISEHLPKLASAMDKFVILRGVSHTLAAHRLGSEYVNCGNRPLPSLQFPSYGSVVTREMGGPADLPPFVSIPRSTQTPGYLGVKYAPLHTNATPSAGRPFSVRGITLGNGVTVSDVEKRQGLLQNLDTAFAGFEQQNQLLEGLDQFSQQAYSMITSKRARDAFDVSKENEQFARQFGEGAFGQSCLLATRLVESGVRFVTVSTGGWDTHRDNWDRLKTALLPGFDEGLAAMLNGLQEKGLLESTAVYVTGEFGRTPKINTERGGRDHYPRCMFMLMAGGGVSGGRVLGESNETATEPLNDGFSPDDVAASFYHNLGIDHTKEYHTNTGRPVMIVREGEVIQELFA